MMDFISLVTSQLGLRVKSAACAELMKWLQNGHASNDQQCSYQTAIGSNVRLGASSRAEETRVETKTSSAQSGSGDKFKETRKLLKNVRLKQWGEEGCSQIGHQEKKKKNTFF